MLRRQRGNSTDLAIRYFLNLYKKLPAVYRGADAVTLALAAGAKLSSTPVFN
jgi:hypothetical protein